MRIPAASSITEDALPDDESFTWIHCGPYASHPVLGLDAIVGVVLESVTRDAVAGTLLESLALARPAAGGVQVVGPGEGQLTQQMVERVTTLLGDSVGQQLKGQQRDRIRALYPGYWRGRNRDERQAMIDLLDVATVLDAQACGQRTLRGDRAPDGLPGSEAVAGRTLAHVRVTGEIGAGGDEGKRAGENRAASGRAAAAG